jgi:hypothetical protein
MPDCGFGPKDEPRKRGSLRLFPTALLLGCIGIALAFMPAAALATSNAPISKTDVVVDNDANGDNVFGDTENVAKNASYPLTVSYRLTLTADPNFGAPILALSDDKTSPLTSSLHSPSCAGLVGTTTVAAGASMVCYYDATLTGPGAAPLVNTANFRWGNGLDVAWDSSTVNFPSISLDKSSSTTLVTALGQVVPYSYAVSNTGTVTVTGIAVSDNNVDATPSCPQSSLAPGASMTCTGQHTVTQGELNSGHVNNTAVASSTEAANATDNLSIPVAVFASGGNFVVGDLTVGPLGQAVGKSVTFWGAQWWKLNALTAGDGPAAFKGFQDAPDTPVCGINWTAKPGNSTPPPATIPAFMAVIVSSGITKAPGPTIAGDTLHLVIVQTNAGYQGNPGHAGTGTIVGVIC